MVVLAKQQALIVSRSMISIINVQVEQIQSDKLQTNLSLVNQKVYYEHEQNILSDSAVCSECENEQAVYFCKSCKPAYRELCEDCKKHRLKVYKTKNHCVVPLDEIKEGLKSESLQDKAKKRETWLYDSHREHIEGARVCYYCSDCDRLMCQHCTVVDHNPQIHGPGKNTIYLIKNLVEDSQEGQPNLKGTI